MTESTNDKLDMQSPDLVNQNFEKLAELFPNCITESATGKAIDFDLLKQELNHAVVEGNKERYRLEWPGKREAIVTANLPTSKTLRPVREDSVDFDNTENIYIEGDNLEVLKLLQESYLGKIKMIYIDPPYNTGNDFVYKDNFAKNKDEELFESGQKDELTQRLVANPETSGRYHSDWLSMIYPRLKLARNLLKNDGVIFISIDDNELHNLKKLCDDIFGESNFFESFIWIKKTAPNNVIVGRVHEYVLVYAKSINLLNLRLQPRTDADNSNYQNPDNDPRGPWMADNITSPAKGGRMTPSLMYALKNPFTDEIHYPPNGRMWSVTAVEMQKKIDDGTVVWGKNNSGRPMNKRFLRETRDGKVMPTLLNDAGSNSNAAKEIQELFDGNVVFETPKPTKLIEKLILLAANEGDLILDFYSGSSTTAHAVFNLNSRDKLKRRFILVQLAEKADQSSEAYKAGYDDISKVGIDRIRRATKKIKEETKAAIDYGFRVYRLDESNMQDVYYRPQDFDQAKLELFADNVKPDRTEDDLLAQVMLEWGLPLSLKIEQAVIAGKKVFKVAENSLFACFDHSIDEAFAKEIAKEQPLRIVFKDAGFKDDTAKTNVKQLLKQLSPETEMKVL